MDWNRDIPDSWDREGETGEPEIPGNYSLLEQTAVAWYPLTWAFFLRRNKKSLVGLTVEYIHNGYTKSSVVILGIKILQAEMVSKSHRYQFGEFGPIHRGLSCPRQFFDYLYSYSQRLLSPRICCHVISLLASQFDSVRLIISFGFSYNCGLGNPFSILWLNWWQAVY